MELERVSRRRFLEGAGASLAAFTPFETFAEPACPEPIYCTTGHCISPKIPDYTQPGTKPVMLARYRPHREGTYRLEKEQIGGQWIVHNYGHSGAGITMSLGCANQVVKKVQEIIDGPDGQDFAKSGIAVLGGGVMGLTAARALVDRYFPAIKVDVFTDKTYKESTSHVAGGQWAPSSVQWNSHDPVEDDLFTTILSDAKKEFIKLGAPYGVSPRINFTLFEEATSGLEIAARRKLICKHKLEQLPFANINTGGFAYETLLVEPPIFLKKIYNYVRARITDERLHHPHVFARRKSHELMSADIAKLSQKIIINCTGLGAGKLFPDDELEPHKGQLVLLPAQKLDYLFSGYRCNNGWAQYMFPRADHLVLGGTYQGASVDETPSTAVGIHIANSLKQLFEHGKKECAPFSADQVDQGPGV